PLLLLLLLLCGLLGLFGALPALRGAAPLLLGAPGPAVLPPAARLVFDVVPPRPPRPGALLLLRGLGRPPLGVPVGRSVPGVDPGRAGPAPKTLRRLALLALLLGGLAVGGGLASADARHPLDVAGRRGAFPGMHHRLGRLAQDQGEHGPGEGELEHLLTGPSTPARSPRRRRR